MRWMTVSLVALLMVSSALVARPDSADTYGRKGNEFYHQDRLQDAIEAYRQALALDPSSSLLKYNLGTAYARKGEVEDAQHALEGAAEVPGAPHRQDAYFNLGVALAQHGIEQSHQEGPSGQGPQLKAAERSLSDGLQAFRQAILADPKDPEAKYNYEITQELLRKLRQEQRKQQQQQQKKQQQNKQGNQQKQSQQKNQSSQNKQQQQQQQQQQGKDQQQKDKSPGAGAQPTATPTPQPQPTPGSSSSADSDQSQSDQNQSQPMTPGQMDAQRILNLLQEERPDQFKKLFQYHGRRQDRDLDKDW